MGVQFHCIFTDNYIDIIVISNAACEAAKLRDVLIVFVTGDTQPDRSFWDIQNPLKNVEGKVNQIDSLSSALSRDDYCTLEDPLSRIEDQFELLFGIDN